MVNFKHIIPGSKIEQTIHYDIKTNIKDLGAKKSLCFKILNFFSFGLCRNRRLTSQQQGNKKALKKEISDLSVCISKKEEELDDAIRKLTFSPLQKNERVLKTTLVKELKEEIDSLNDKIKELNKHLKGTSLENSSFVKKLNNNKEQICYLFQKFPMMTQFLESLKKDREKALSLTLFDFLSKDDSEQAKIFDILGDNDIEKKLEDVAFKTSLKEISEEELKKISLKDFKDIRTIPKLNVYLLEARLEAKSKKKAEEEKRKQEEELQKKNDESKKQTEELIKKADELKRKAEEDKKKAEEERRKQAEEIEKQKKEQEIKKKAEKEKEIASKNFIDLYWMDYYQKKETLDLLNLDPKIRDTLSSDFIYELYDSLPDSDLKAISLRDLKKKETIDKLKKLLSEINS